MHGSIVKSLSAAAFAVCIVAGTAAAQGKGHEKEHGNGKGDEKHRADEQHVVVVDPRHDNDPRRVVTTNNGVYRKVPPGLAKKGGLPPGQAKKYYRASQGVPVMREVFLRHGYTVVRTQPYGTSQYVYYRQANGPIQRAVIVPGSSQLGFQNVPQSLISEILARLY
jgi:ABC-type oligopeptide transport system substrate-binding subunit